ncbi:allantoin permease [Paracoccidioides lutzii Pb01]|uniref:Allantoin permease n=1 Tax=Paracoccidioides lutzii (strain ATCC MYA-826 / Pb01) TaxID=502779 RepID=C1H7F6_PARBA|nr:allantoin permease [Paracoccidioides lutzii Pb01]EEH35650.2 allantoin permease [Paracoccidioides lutzii Pb01]
MSHKSEKVAACLSIRGQNAPPRFARARFANDRPYDAAVRIRGRLFHQWHGRIHCVLLIHLLSHTSMKFRLPSLHVEQPKSAFAEGNLRWTNRDLDPIPRHLRKWGVASLTTYWISDAVNIGTWQFASGIIAVGLSWRESLGIVALAFFIISWVIAFNGATGVIYHSPFPVLARASWGFRGSFIAVISRVILAVFWFAIQNVNGGNSVRTMIGAIWPSFLRLPNHIPESQGITTNGMVGYLIFFIIQFPFLCMHPNNLRWLFMAKSVLVPIAWIAMLIWAFKSTNGGEIFSQHRMVSGSAYSWAFLASLTSVIGNFSTLSVNQADFSRYSRVSVKWQALYVPMLPIVFTFISFIGVAVSSAAQSKYKLADIPWDPNIVVSLWENRACRFFGAFSLALSSLGVNISANSISAANDLMAVAPRFVNIRRGQLLCALLSWILLPWKILKSVGSFLNFMSAYAVFLGPIAGIMLFDFWVVKERKYDCVALYQPDNIYWYTNGVNWRAILAFVVGVAPTLPGLFNSVNHNIDPGVGVHVYQIGWFVGIVGASLVYLSLSYVFPATATRIECAILPDDIYMPQNGDVDGVPGAEHVGEQ